jgi:hypothetical protein
MKKIITMLFCTAVFSAAFSQSNHPEYNNTNNNPYWNSNGNQKGYQRDHDRDDDRRNNNVVYQNSNSSNRQRDIQVQRISQQFDSRIQQVMYNRSLNPRQKQYAIQELQAQKAREINGINSQYSYNNEYDTRRFKDNERDDRSSRYNR